MAQTSALDDSSTRSAVLLALRSGKSVGAAARAVGCSRTSIYRYSDRHPEFRDAMILAQADGERVRAVGKTCTLPADVADEEIHKAPPPRSESAKGAEALKVEEEMVVDADAFTVEESVTVDIDGDLPALSVRSFLNLCWRRANEERTDAARWARLLAPVLLTPTIRAQERREAVLDLQRQRALEAEQESTVSRGSGVVFVEIPRNGSEAPGHGPQSAADESIMDAEVV